MELIHSPIGQYILPELNKRKRDENETVEPLSLSIAIHHSPFTTINDDILMISINTK